MAPAAVQTPRHAAASLSDKRWFLDYTSVEIKKSWASPSSFPASSLRSPVPAAQSRDGIPHRSVPRDI